MISDGDKAVVEEGVDAAAAPSIGFKAENSPIGWDMWQNTAMGMEGGATGAPIAQSSGARRARLLICSNCRVWVLMPMHSTVPTASSFRALLPSAVLADSDGSTLLSINTELMDLVPLLAKS